MAEQAAVYCLGSINLDFHVRSERWPAETETLQTTDFLRSAGGKAANRAYVARKLGQPAVLLGTVGDDDFGAEALQPLRQLGVNLKAVRTARHTPTGVSTIVVRPDGTKTILLAANANGVNDEAYVGLIERTLAAACAGSIVSLDLEVPAAYVEAALSVAQRQGLTVVLDPSPADRMQQDYYEQVDWLTPNHSEAERISGIKVINEESAAWAAEALVTSGAKGACVKLSNGGCLAMLGREHCLAKAPGVRVVDITGAGDAFAAALSVALLERQAIPNALAFAVHYSSLATTAYGSQASYVDRHSLEQSVSSDPH